MKWRCRWFGHKLGEWEPHGPVRGNYRRDCVRCGALRTRGVFYWGELVWSEEVND